ncbi:hypothetical protein G6F43_012532 [Rhizopus delemar]|nr:hypothetical protein G6F43_012532 [Rhizopus delemar]
MQMQNLSIKRQKKLQQKPYTSQPVSAILEKKKKPTKPWHSLPRLSNRFTKHALNNHYSETMLEDTSTITEEDSILEERTSTLEDNQEVVLDNSTVSNLFLGEAITTPSPNRTSTTHNDNYNNHLNNNKQAVDFPIFFNKKPHISRPALRDTRRWDITRGSSPIIQPVLEIQNPPPLAIGGDSGRISNSVEFEPTPMEISPYQIQDIRGPTSSGPSSIEVLGGRNNREITFTEQGVSIQLLHDPRGNQKTSDFGLQSIEQVCTMPALQNGGHSSLTIDFGKRRFDLQNRLEGCLRGSTSPSSIQTISDLFTSGCSISIQGPSIWIKRSSPRIFKTHALCSGTIEDERDTTGVLFGRHMPGCEIQKGNASEHGGNAEPSEESGISDQLQEKQSPASKDSRVFRVSIQHVQDDNRTSSTKVEKDCEQDPTSEENNDKLLMQMDSQSNWENDCSNSSNRRSITPPSIPTTRSSAEPSASSSKLGKPVPINKTKFRGSRMVGEICKDSQRPSNTQRGSQSSTSNRYLRRRLRQRVRDKQLRTRNSWVLDRSRTININKRKRIADSMDCITTARRKISAKTHQDIFRQYDSHQVCDESRWNSITDTTRFSTQDTSTSQPIPDKPTMHTYSRNQQHQSRSTEQDAQTTLRMELTEENISTDTTKVGTTLDRRICSSSQSSTTKVLEHTSGSYGSTDRRIQATMAGERLIPPPSVEINSVSVEAIQGTEAAWKLSNKQCRSKNSN